MFNIGNRRGRIIVISLCLVLLVSVGTGAVLSYISYKTPPVENILEAGRVECIVQETFDGSEKTDVTIKNTGNTTAYIRAAVLISWQSESDETEILARVPKEGEDYEITYGDLLWMQGDDGYWYYASPVEPDSATRPLIERVAPLGDAPDGYALSVEILATAIQANPITVVKDEWGVTNSDELIVP